MPAAGTVLTVSDTLIDVAERRLLLRWRRYCAIAHELLAELSLPLEAAGRAWLVRPRGTKMWRAEAVGWADLAEGRASRPPAGPLGRPRAMLLYGPPPPLSPPPTAAERHLAALEREARGIEDEVTAVLLGELRAREWLSTSTSARTARASGDTPPTFWDVDGITFEPADDTIWVDGQVELRGVRFQRAIGVAVSAETAGDAPALRRVRDPGTISDAITQVYDGCDLRGEPIPNINETGTTARAWLNLRRLDATLTDIKEIAEQPEFAERRGRSGVRRPK
jgi:hypothetical protein